MFSVSSDMLPYEVNPSFTDTGLAGGGGWGKEVVISDNYISDR